MKAEVHSLFVKDLSILLLRGWVTGYTLPKVARLRNGSETVLATFDAWYERSDVSTSQGEKAYGFTITTLYSPTDTFSHSVDVIAGTGELLQITVPQPEQIDNFVVRPKPGQALDPVKLAKPLLDAVTGEEKWLNHLRRQQPMRRLIASDRKLLVEDVRASEHSQRIMRELLSSVFNNDQPQTDEALTLREMILNIAGLDGAGRTAGDQAGGAVNEQQALDALVSKLDAGTATPDVVEALTTLFSAALNGQSALKSVVSASPKYQSQLAKLLSSAGATSPGIRMQAMGANSAITSEALNTWQRRDDFDAALARTLFQSTLLTDLMEENPDILEALSKNTAVVERIGRIAAVEQAVLKRHTQPRLEGERLADPARRVRAKAVARDATPLFSVVLGIYNGAEFLAETMDSVQQQTFKDYEFIIVDDASTDATLEIVQSYAKQDERIRIVRHPMNLGQAGAFNTGVKEARGEYIAFLDADDLWLPAKLEACAKYLDLHDGIKFMQHNLKLLMGSWPSERLFRPVLPSGDYIQQMHETGASFPGPFSPTAGLIFSRKLLERIGPIPVALRTCADGFLTRAAAALTNVCSMPVPLGYYRLHGSNSTIGNDDYDVDVYSAKIIAPIVQEFYDTLDPPIELPRVKRTRQRRVLRVPNDIACAEPSAFDLRLQDALAYVTLNLPPERPFSAPLAKLLLEVRRRITRGDYEGTCKQVLKNPNLPEPDGKIANALDAWFHTSAADWSWLATALPALMKRTDSSASITGLSFRVAVVRGDTAGADRMLAEHMADGYVSQAEVNYASNDRSLRSPVEFLAAQRAVMKKSGYSSAYYDSREWIVEQSETVDGWSNSLRRDKTRAKMFAVRRHAPPSPIADIVAKLPLDPTQDAHLDWTRAAALDLAGATVFTGEWVVKSVEGYSLSDLNSGTPHHAPSAYGATGQLASTYNLLYSGKSESIGPAFLIGGDDNYYHWIHDVAPRIAWQQADERFKDMQSLVGRPNRGFQKQILDAFGVPDERLIKVDYPCVVNSDRLVVPLVSPQNRTFRPVYGQIRRWAHDQLGAKMTPGFETSPWKSRKDGKRLFVMRGAVGHRRMINETEMAGVFADAGFEVIDSAKYTVAQQVELFNQASVVVGVHGAALANLCFSRPKTKVIELAFANWSPRYFEVIGEDRGLSCERIFLRTAINPVVHRHFYDGWMPKTTALAILESAARATSENIDTDEASQ